MRPETDETDLLRADVETALYRLREDGEFPNHPEFPAVHYRGALRLPQRGDPAALIEGLFARHGWTSSWRDTVYDFPHYHSNAHEALGCFAGEASLQIGGRQGPLLQMAPGDVLVMPAGTAHRRVRSDAGFCVVGAYDRGADYDMCRAGVEGIVQNRESIRNVPQPRQDPVFGAHGQVAWLGGREA
jgi:uncharacterized protein YjlB